MNCRYLITNILSNTTVVIIYNDPPSWPIAVTSKLTIINIFNNSNFWLYIQAHYYISSFHTAQLIPFMQIFRISRYNVSQISCYILPSGHMLFKCIIKKLWIEIYEGQPRPTIPFKPMISLTWNSSTSSLVSYHYIHN